MFGYSSVQVWLFLQDCRQVLRQKYPRSVRFLSVRPTRRTRCPFVWSLVTFTAHVHHLIKEVFDSVNITVKVTLLPFVMSKEPVGRYLGTL